MDHKKNTHSRRSKRQNKITEDNYWDCSVCTYRNTAEAFKCLMCDVRKGTSTRKPRINPQLVAQQVAQQYTQSVPKVKKESAPGSVASSSTTPIPTPTTTTSTSNSSHSISTTTTSSTITTTASLSVSVSTTTTTNTTNVTTSTATANPISSPSVSSAKVESVAPAPAPVPAPAPAPANANKLEKRYSPPSVETKSSSSTRRLRPKLKNVDRSSAEHKAVTVNNVTVIITEFQPKRHYSSSSDHGGHNQSSGSTGPGSNHSSGGRGGGNGGGGGAGTFQMEAGPAENGLHPELSHKHQRLAL
ncbi:hypothetical protein CHUAL_011812 [Chamberlinius hualienensis]